MNAEVKQMKGQQAADAKGHEVIQAAKAVGQLPKNFINQIRDLIHTVDSKDEKRRKEFISEPGFRKKTFHNLSLALLYGGAATVKLTMVPVMMVCRHFSKEKDKRIRNELISELESEISICEEKINDANNEGLRKEKYKLMRIRDQLKRELTRVQYNSKYI